MLLFKDGFETFLSLLQGVTLLQHHLQELTAFCGLCVGSWDVPVTNLAEQTHPKGSQHCFTGVGLSTVATSCQLPQEFLPSTSWDLGVASS